MEVVLRLHASLLVQMRGVAPVQRGLHPAVRFLLFSAQLGGLVSTQLIKQTARLEEWRQLTESYDVSGIAEASSLNCLFESRWRSQ